MMQKIKLKSYTQSVMDPHTLSSLSIEEYIAKIARVSNPSNENNHKTGKKLIKHLLKEKHWSPLEMVDFTYEIITTRDIARQILRHRSFQFQEFSQRYADPQDLQEDMFIRECRLQDTKNRQNSVDTDDEKLAQQWEAAQQQLMNDAMLKYNWAINQGIAKEQARAVLPEGMTPSRLYMKGSLRSWIHYIDLRSGNGTQKEHQSIAKMIGSDLATHLPSLKEWLSVV